MLIVKTFCSDFEIGDSFCVIRLKSKKQPCMAYNKNRFETKSKGQNRTVKVKKYKTNSFAAVCFYMLEIGLPFCIAIPLMIFFLGGDSYSAGEILSTVPMTFFGMLGVAAFFYALNIFTLPFKKHSVFLEEKTFEYNGEVFEYGSVTEIKINSGNISRVHSFNTPCSLEIYTRYSRKHTAVAIKSPSFFMIFALARRCKGAKLRYKNIMRALIMLLINVAVCFMIATVG